MSLISVRNVVAPLSNKVHLVTIIVITLVFGIYRASGGTVEVVDRGSKAHSKSNPFVAVDNTSKAKSAGMFGSTEERSIEQQPAPVDATSDDSFSFEDEDYLDTVLGSHAKSAQKQEAAPRREGTQAAAPSDNGGLEDIEKSLGLK